MISQQMLFSSQFQHSSRSRSPHILWQRLSDVSVSLFCTLYRIWLYECYHIQSVSAHSMKPLLYLTGVWSIPLLASPPLMGVLCLSVDWNVTTQYFIYPRFTRVTSILQLTYLAIELGNNTAIRTKIDEKHLSEIHISCVNYYCWKLCMYSYGRYTT